MDDITGTKSKRKSPPIYTIPAPVTNPETSREGAAEKVVVSESTSVEIITISSFEPYKAHDVEYRTGRITIRLTIKIKYFIFPNFQPH